MTKTLSGVSDVVIHLDDRWAECQLARSGRPMFPSDGLVAAITEDHHINTQGIYLVSVLARHAANGSRHLVLDDLLPEYAQRLGLVGDNALDVARQWAVVHVDALVRRGYIAVAGGGGA